MADEKAELGVPPPYNTPQVFLTPEQQRQQQWEHQQLLPPDQQQQWKQQHPPQQQQQNTSVQMVSGYQQVPVITHTEPPISFVCALVLSFVVCGCGGIWACCCGIASFVLALCGQCKAAEGQTSKARQLLHASYGVGIVGVVAIVVFVIVYFMFLSHSFTYHSGRLYD